MQEYKCTCDSCYKSGSETFARVYFRKIKNKWMYLCSECWEKLSV